MSTKQQSSRPAPSPLRYRFDGSGAWFATIERQGENMDIRFGKKHFDQSQVKWIDGISHTRYDGMGGFVHLLRRHGHSGFASFPKLKAGDHPIGLWEWLKLTARSLRRKKPPATRAANLRLALATESAIPARRPREKRHPASSLIFSEEETRLLLHSAKGAGVTLNTALLFALNRALRRVLADPSADFPWMIPVNMRGGVEMQKSTANHASMIDLVCLHDDSLKSLHGRIQDLLSEKRHWWHWHYLQLTARAGRYGRAGIHRLQKSRRKAIGSFSNLGNWELPPHPRIEAWLFAPPVSARQTIGGGCVTAYGRLTLTLQIHHSVPGAQVLAEQILEEWRRELAEALKLPRNTLPL